MGIASYPIGEVWREKYDDEGLQKLAVRLKILSPKRVAFEATGGLEVRVSSVLKESGFPVVVLNPRQVRDFAKATGQLAKTDKLDALIIGQFAAVLKPPIRKLKTDKDRLLDSLLTRRR